MPIPIPKLSTNRPALRALRGKPKPRLPAVDDYTAAFPRSCRLEVEAPADDPFHHPVLARARHTLSDTDVELPIGRGVQVQGGEDQMMLLVKDIEVGNRAGLGVILEARFQELRQLVGDLHRRLHSKTAMRVLALQ